MYVNQINEMFSDAREEEAEGVFLPFTAIWQTGNSVLPG